MPFGKKVICPQCGEYVRQDQMNRHIGQLRDKGHSFTYAGEQNATSSTPVLSTHDDFTNKTDYGDGFMDVDYPGPENAVEDRIKQSSRIERLQNAGIHFSSDSETHLRCTIETTCFNRTNPNRAKSICAFQQQGTI